MSWRFRGGSLDEAGASHRGGGRLAAPRRNCRRHTTSTPTDSRPYRNSAQTPRPSSRSRPWQPSAQAGPASRTRAAFSKQTRDPDARLTLLRSWTGRLVKLADDDAILALFHPSLMMDHWGFDLFFRDLAAYYGHLANGRPLTLAPCGQFSAFAAHEHQCLRDGTWQASIDYWSIQYAGQSPLPILNLPPLGDSQAPFLSGDAVTGILHAESVRTLRKTWPQVAGEGVDPVRVHARMRPHRVARHDR